MHDPMTVAFEVKYPWWKHRPWPKRFQHPESRRFAWQRIKESIPIDKWKRMDECWDQGYRDTFLTVWHIDPERDGSDDSCGWSAPKLTRKQKSILHNASWSEGRNPHFLRCPGKEWMGTIADAESLYRGLALVVNRVLRLNLSLDAMTQWAAERVHFNSGCGTAGDTFCFLPGYHTNRKKDTKDDREQHFESILCGVARQLLDLKRHWWQHPKWHFWHWRIQCHPLTNFKRWAFSRCCKCGKRFPWGYAPVTNNWSAVGPRWFRSEKDTFHSDCDRPNNPWVAQAVKGACDSN